MPIGIGTGNSAWSLICCPEVDLQRGRHLHSTSGIWGKYRRHIPLERELGVLRG